MGVARSDPPRANDGTAQAGAGKKAPRKRWLSVKARRRIKRGLIGVAIAVPVALGAAWYAANHVPWFGAWAADTLRSVIGTEGVADLEEFAYDTEDRWNRFWREGEQPKAYWDSPAGSGTPNGSGPPSAAPPSPGTAVIAPSSTPSAAASGSAAAPGAFQPKDVGPYNPKYAAPGDGAWVPVTLPESPADPPLLYKTLIHPDPKRPWAEVFVVAIDLPRVQLRIVAGTREPKGTAPGASELERTGLIPATDLPTLVAGWNGGFKEEHGHYGMKLGTVLIIRPRADACTIAMTESGELRIEPWKTAQDAESTFRWWRQTPACLIASGKLHPGLHDENTNWGAAIGGATVVRRSAAGLDSGGKVLFVAVSNHTTPRTLAIAMEHVGAAHAAQLDINYSYPRFVLFPKNATGERESASLFDGFKVEKDDYVRAPSVRDFFYVVRP